MGKYCGHIPLSYLCCAYSGFDYVSFTAGSTLNLPCSSSSGVIIVFVILALICIGAILVVVTITVAILIWRQRSKQTFEESFNHLDNNDINNDKIDECNENNKVGEVQVQNNNGYGTI